MSRISTKQVLTDFWSRLKQDGTVNGLVNERVFPLVGAQNGPRPFVVYNLITNRQSLTHDGDASQGEFLIQVDSYGDSYAASLEVADALRNELMGTRVTIGSTEFQVGLLNDEDGLYEEDTELFRTRQDFSLTAAIGSELPDWLAADWDSSDWEVAA